MLDTFRGQGRVETYRPYLFYRGLGTGVTLTSNLIARLRKRMPLVYHRHGIGDTTTSIKMAAFPKDHHALPRADKKNFPSQIGVFDGWVKTKLGLSQEICFANCQLPNPSHGFNRVDREADRQKDRKTEKQS